MFNRDDVVGYTNGVINLCIDGCWDAEDDQGFMPISRKNADGESVCDSCGEFLLADEIAAEEAYYRAEWMHEKAMQIEDMENAQAQDHWDQLVDEADNLRKEAKERG